MKASSRQRYGADMTSLNCEGEEESIGQDGRAMERLRLEGPAPVVIRQRIGRSASLAFVAFLAAVWLIFWLIFWLMVKKTL